MAQSSNRNKGSRRGGGRGRNQNSGRRSSTSRPNRERIRRTPRPEPSIGRKILSILTFGIVKADPYAMPNRDSSGRKVTEQSKAATPSGGNKNKSGAPKGGEERSGKKKTTSDRRSRRQKKAASGEQSPRAAKSGEERTERRATKKPESVVPTTPRIYVGNLSYDTTEEHLIELFSSIAKVESAEIVSNRRSGRSKGYGFVTMPSVEDAKSATKLHDQDFMGRKLTVSGAKSTGPEEKPEQKPQEESETAA